MRAQTFTSLVCLILFRKTVSWLLLELRRQINLILYANLQTFARREHKTNMRKSKPKVKDIMLMETNAYLLLLLMLWLWTRKMKLKRFCFFLNLLFCCGSIWISFVKFEFGTLDYEFWQILSFFWRKIACTILSIWNTFLVNHKKVFAFSKSRKKWHKRIKSSSKLTYQIGKWFHVVH